MKNNKIAHGVLSIGILVIFLDWIIFYSYYLTICGFIIFCVGVVKSCLQEKKVLKSHSILVPNPQSNRSSISQSTFELESRYEPPILQQEVQKVEN